MWTLCQINCLSPFHLFLLLGFCVVPSFGTHSSISSFYLIPCACFYILCRLVVSSTWTRGLPIHSLEGYFLCRLHEPLWQTNYFEWICRLGWSLPQLALGTASWSGFQCPGRQGWVPVWLAVMCLGVGWGWHKPQAPVCVLGVL